MTYLSDLAYKMVESVDPYVGDYEGAQPFDKIADVRFTDGTKMSIHIDSRSFYYQGEEVRQTDLDMITNDLFFKGGVVHYPQPPRFRFPKDPVLHAIMLAFKELQPRLMNFHGGSERTDEKFEQVIAPWEETVRRYFGYRRANNLTSALSVSIQNNERRAPWSMKLSNSRAMRRLATALQCLSSESRRKVRRA